MTEYIDRDKILRILGRYSTQNGAALGRHSGAIDCLMEEIERVPTADVEPVRHGYWDDSMDGITPYCSVCGHSHRLMRRILSYCPECGAKMDGGDEANENRKSDRDT